ncbi:MAG: hypothetical protein PHC97_04395 [Patescibacteria group bacterium]|nr:hypothetical protein [Patescibacteria group bacterium]
MSRFLKERELIRAVWKYGSLNKKNKYSARKGRTIRVIAAIRPLTNPKYSIRQIRQIKKARVIVTNKSRGSEIKSEPIKKIAKNINKIRVKLRISLCLTTW